MISARAASWAALACAAAIAARPAQADGTTYEDIDGIRYQVTRRTVQVPIPGTAQQQQTTYRQQMSTQTVQHQQLYTVPVTQYQLVSRLHGRWNPFITPYWTHHYEPVTTWQQQTATVQIPVSTMAWVPETRTVQAPTTTYRAVEQLVRTPIGAAPGATGSQQMLASGGGATSGPTATLAARPGAASGTSGSASVPTVAAAPATTTYGAQGTTYGGQAMSSDPPRQASGWTTPDPSSRYR